MTILGTYEKQPREVLSYAIQFAEDMAETDAIAQGYTAVTIGKKPVAGRTVTAPYAATLADDGTLFFTEFPITIPVDAPVGYRIMAANTDQDAAVSVAGIQIPARCSAVIFQSDTGPVTEIAVTTVLVAGEYDQRVRMIVSKGFDKTTYKVQATAITEEGYTLEDEMILKVKED